MQCARTRDEGEPGATQLPRPLAGGQLIGRHERHPVPFGQNDEVAADSDRCRNAGRHGRLLIAVMRVETRGGAVARRHADIPSVPVFGEVDDAALVVTAMAGMFERHTNRRRAWSFSACATRAAWGLSRRPRTRPHVDVTHCADDARVAHPPASTRRSRLVLLALLASSSRWRSRAPASTGAQSRQAAATGAQSSSRGPPRGAPGATR
jgi:hypothetical protein